MIDVGARVRLLERLGVLAVCGLSIASWYVVSRAHMVLAYNDAMSHLDIARRVFDNLQPGIAQIGTVWLPMNQILDMALVWNTWAWHSGFAGSIISMLSYVCATIGVYKIIVVLANRRLAAAIGAIVFAVNPNVLYLQSTPLTELLFLALFVWCAYCFVCFTCSDDARYLVALGALGFAAVLTRYDAWFVMGVIGVVILAQQRYIGRTWKRAVGRALLATTPALFGIVLWLIWNACFGNPLDFMFGPGSASAQQQVIAAANGLATKHNLALSAWVYLHAASDNVGLVMAALALFGLGYWLLMSNWLASHTRWLVAVVLVSPLIFNILALDLGFSTIQIPELTWPAAGTWFNVRYGILMLPMVAVAVGLFATWARSVALALGVVAVLSAIQIMQAGPITVLDGTQGASAFVEPNSAHALSRLVASHQHVLMSFSTFSPVAFASNLALSDFVHEGVSREWSRALVDPSAYTQWIVTSTYNTGDPVYTALKLHNPKALSAYKIVYSDSHATIYQLKDMQLASQKTVAKKKIQVTSSRTYKSRSSWPSNGRFYIA